MLAVLILAASNRGSNRPWCHIHAVVGCLAADERPASGKVPSVLGHRLEHRGLVIGLVVLVGLSAAAALAAQVLFDPYSVPSSSMAPAVGPGDRVLAWSYVWGGPQRGDIVIFEPPPAASADGATFPSVIGRVVGVGGDLIGFANGELMVNGQVPDERYLAAGTVTNGRASVEVPSGSIYVLGDSRETAQDSRSYGARAQPQRAGACRVHERAARLDHAGCRRRRWGGTRPRPSQVSERSSGSPAG